MLEYKKINDNLKIVSFKEDKINSVISNALKEELKKEAENFHLILNLDNIRFIDSSGFGAFLAIYKEAKNNNTKLAFCNLSEDIFELVKLMSLQSIFKIFEDEASAVNFI